MLVLYLTFQKLFYVFKLKVYIIIILTLGNNNM